jgi:hypothetical protein
VLVAFPSAERVISNGLSFESLTAQTPSNSLDAKLAKLAMTIASPATSVVERMVLMLFMGSSWK